MGFIVHEAKFHIRFGPFINIVVREKSREIPLVLALQVFVVIVVEYSRRAGTRLRPRQEAGAYHGEALSNGRGLTERLKTIGIGTAEAFDASSNGRSCLAVRPELTIRKITRRGGYGRLIVEDHIAGDVAGAIGEVRSHDHR